MEKELSKKEGVKIKCPLCKEKIPSNAVRCSKCTGDLSTGEAQQDIQEQLHKRKKKQIIVGSLIVFLLIIGILASSGNEQKAQTGSSNEQEAQTSQSSTSSFLAVGEDGILNNNSVKTNCNGNSILGTSKENYDELTKTLVADDRLGYLQMIGNGQIFLVENCTKVKKIGGSFAISEVRILEGEYFGTSGWIAFEFAVKE